MKIKTLDGLTKTWSFSTIDSDHKSNLHKIACELITEVFPTVHYKEEVQIEIKSNKFLYLDFYIPLYKIAIEVDGQQHTKYSNFLNKSPINFIKQKINDKLKQDWCDLNNISLIRLDFSESKDDWRNKLISFGIDNEE